MRTAASSPRWLKSKALTKSFDGHTVFRDLTLEFPAGELSVIMGPSGCGKSTLLRCINFLEMFDSGRISIGELSVSWKEGEARRCPRKSEVPSAKCGLQTGMVFQSFNLFPHLTALENVTLAPMQVKGMNADEATRLGKAILERVGLQGMTDKYPSTLSGGQQQRVAIARSLAMQPKSCCTMNRHRSSIRVCGRSVQCDAGTEQREDDSDRRDARCAICAGCDQPGSRF